MLLKPTPGRPRRSCLALRVAVARRGWLFAAVVALLPVGCGLNRQGALETTGVGATGAATTTTTSGSGGAGIGGFTPTGGSGTTTSSSTAGAGGQATGEDCLNGTDDDGDGAVDCADTDCAGPYSCVALDAANVHFVTAPAEECADGLESVSFYSCDNCGCTPSGGNCLMTVTLYKHGDCTNGTVTVAQTADVTCDNITNFADHGGNKIGARATSAPDGLEACEASGDGATPVAAEWCASPAGGGGCDLGQVCLPNVMTPWCVAVPITQSCPAGTNRVDRVFTTAGSGSCDCTCGATASCPPTQTAEVSPADNCTNAGNVPVSADDQCVDTGLAEARAVGFAPQAATVTCNRQVTLPGADEVRICCL